MILNNTINAGNFIYCMAYWGPNETSEYFAGGNGHFHQYGYIVDGWGATEIRNDRGGEVIEFNDMKQPGVLLDLSHTENTYQSIITSDSSLTVMFFNPVPTTRKLSVEILNIGGEYDIEAKSTRKVVVCITGPASINEKPLASLQHAKIFPGKQAKLILPEHAVCAVVTEV